VAGPGAAE